MNRRRFVELGLLGALSTGLGPLGAKTPRRENGFFTLTQKQGRHWLVDPAGQPFWSVGINHIDPATLRYADSGDVWAQEYGNSMEQWLDAVREDLTGWGFNTMGWNQEVVLSSEKLKMHSRNFTYEEYQWLGMPYCHMLPFIESHQWDVHTRLPDIRSQGFADWCDYVARDDCARMKDDPNLMGYFFTDCPTWIHSSEATAWKAPIFDPDMLKTAAGKRELHDLATTYYRVTTEAIKRYDPNHLILGDRYEAARPIAEEVLTAAKPYVDVFGFQCFGGPQAVAEQMGKWVKFLDDKPVLLADSASWFPTAHQGWPPQEDRHLKPEAYAAIMQVLQAMPQCVGFHLCGAYLRNQVRRYGLKDAQDQIDPSTPGIQAVNESVHAWAASF